MSRVRVPKVIQPCWAAFAVVVIQKSLILQPTPHPLRNNNTYPTRIEEQGREITSFQPPIERRSNTMIVDKSKSVYSGDTSENDELDGDDRSAQSMDSEYFSNDMLGNETNGDKADSITSKTSGSHTIRNGEGGGETIEVFRGDKRVRLLRDTALMLLVLTALFVSMGVYISLKASEQREFDNTFEDQAAQLGSVLQSQLETKLRALDTLSVSLASFARSEEYDWPTITVPDFAARAASTLRASRATALAIHPVVQGANLTRWEEYSVQAQGWLEDSLEFQSRQSSDRIAPHPRLLNVSEFVYQVVDGVPTRVVVDDDNDNDNDNIGDKVVLPLWEYFPTHDELSPVNYDAMSDRFHRDAVRNVLDNHVAVLGQSFDLSRSYHG